MSLTVLDAQGNAIQVIRFTAPQSMAAGATSTTASDVTGAICRVVADIAICYTFEGNAATTDHFLPANVIEYPPAPVGAKTFSFITATGTAGGVLGTVWLAESV